MIILGSMSFKLSKCTEVQLSRVDQFRRNKNALQHDVKLSNAANNRTRTRATMKTNTSGETCKKVSSSVGSDHSLMHMKKNETVSSDSITDDASLSQCNTPSKPFFFKQSRQTKAISRSPKKSVHK